MDNSVCTIIDDSPMKIGKKYFGITVERYDAIRNYVKDKIILVPCTLNKNDLRRMETKIRELSVHGMKIIVPWGGDLE